MKLMVHVVFSISTFPGEQINATESSFRPYNLTLNDWEVTKSQIKELFGSPANNSYLLDALISIKLSFFT